MSQGGDLFAPSIFMAVPSNNIVARIGRSHFGSRFEKRGRGITSPLERNARKYAPSSELRPACLRDER